MICTVMNGSSEGLCAASPRLRIDRHPGGFGGERRSRGDSTGERSAGDFQCLQLGSVFPLGHKELHSSFSLSLGVIYFGKEDGIVGPLRCEKVNEKEKKKG